MTFMEFKGNLKQAEDDDVMIDERDKITKFVWSCKYPLPRHKEA